MKLNKKQKARLKAKTKQRKKQKKLLLIKSRPIHKRVFSFLASQCGISC